MTVLLNQPLRKAIVAFCTTVLFVAGASLVSIVLHLYEIPPEELLVAAIEKQADTNNELHPFVPAFLIDMQLKNPKTVENLKEKSISPFSLIAATRGDALSKTSVQVEPINSKSIELSTFYIEKDFDINEFGGTNGRTALSHAILMNDKFYIHWLLNQGANPRLTEAPKHPKNSCEVFEKVREHGVTPNKEIEALMNANCN